MGMNAFWTYKRQFSAKKERFKVLTLMEKILSRREQRDRQMQPKTNTTD